MSFPAPSSPSSTRKALHTTLSLNTETTYDWSNDQWTVPVNFQVSQLFKIAGQPVQAFVGARYYAEKPDDGPEWGIRCGLAFLFPKQTSP